MHIRRFVIVELKWMDFGFGNKDIGEIICRDELITSAHYIWWISNGSVASQPEIGYEDSIKR